MAPAVQLTFLGDLLQELDRMFAARPVDVEINKILEFDHAPLFPVVRRSVKPALTPSYASILSAPILQRQGRDMDDLESIIERAWEKREEVTPKTKDEVRKAVDRALAMLDVGEVRVAERKD